MNGTMMDYPLTLVPMLERAGKLFSKVEIVSRLPDRSLHRTTYADFYRRARALAESLSRAGLKPGDRVGTFPRTSTGKFLKSKLREQFAD